MLPLTQVQLATFARDGFVCVPGFYDRQAEIEPIQRAVYDIIGLVIRRHGLSIRQEPFEPTCFDSGFNELIATERRFGSEVYDAVKMIPAFVRLAASEKSEAVLQQLRESTLAGFISHGYGIRIDIPGEDKYRALWHQEYLFQLRSRDGITIWSPLIAMTPELGPVHFAVGSHRDGTHRVFEGDRRKPGAYAWTLENESELLAKYPQVAPLANPGDAIILDFQVLHCSGFNRSHRARWSMQMRLFNFLEPSGMLTGWPGSVAEGVRVPEIFPEFFHSGSSGGLFVNGCYVCGAQLGEPIYTSGGRGSMTTMLKVYDSPTVVSFCNSCGHLQTNAIVDPDDYYAHQYSILAETNDEDLLYKVVDGRRIFQVEHRVATLLAKTPLPRDALVLDFGCAKGSVLRRLHQSRPDVTPYYFDVTDRYLSFWQQAAEPKQWAVGSVPPDWNEQFDLVCSFYVLEHVQDPVATIASMTRLIKPGGYFYAIVPNVLANPADLIVADHLQHFSENSWLETLQRAGLSLVEVDENVHESALVVVARKSQPVSSDRSVRRSTDELRRKYVEMSVFWSEMGDRVRSFERSLAGSREACIYGPGFYGNFIASCLDQPSTVTCFVDQNPHLVGRRILDKPIVAPTQLPAEVEILYAGLNPSIARGVIADIPCWRGRPMDVFYL